jgi:D-alanyl-lipoteichoic acid acyltransferase DltB (MBOAT superfamily)
MLFNSYTFIFAFLPLTLVGFFALGGRGYQQSAVAWLVGASLLFYGWWNPTYLGLLLISVCFNYGVGIALSGATAAGHPSRRLLILGLAVNLGLLGYFKYANFAVLSAAALLGVKWNLETIVLPLAISFFTFNQLAYLVDAHRGLAKEYQFLRHTASSSPSSHT